MKKKIRVLVIDDSALVRQILTRGLSQDPELEIVGSAPDPFEARDKIIQLEPDVLTLDVEMPKMDGVQFLRRLMPQYPLPVIIVSSLTEKGGKITLDALDAGAIDFVTKPSTDIARGLTSMMAELREMVKMASKVDVSRWKNKPITPKVLKPENYALAKSTDKVIAIGASTGGTEALRRVITQFPPNTPGIVVVQHMPPGFTKMYAERLNDICPLDIKEAETGDRIIQGRVLIAPGGLHMTVRRSGGIYLVDCKPGEKVCGHCPSVEVLFDSVAKYVGANAVGAILTGMGSDGADGMVRMRKNGARTLAQDEKTSVVFGMPAEAYNRGGAEILVPLNDISSVILNYVTKL